VFLLQRHRWRHRGLTDHAGILYMSTLPLAEVYTLDEVTEEMHAAGRLAQ
jgi:hypothetical protein